MAQSGGIFTGTIRDVSGVPVPNAQLMIQDEATGLRQTVQADSRGHYESIELAPGQYRFTVRCEAFRTLHAFGVPLKDGELHRADFLMKLLPVHQEMTVVSTPDSIDPTATGIAVERHSVANNLPANGHDLHALYTLLPGAVLTPAAAADGGQFSVAGQRPNTNTFRIDGISGNTGVGLSAVPGAFPGSTLPAMSVTGSTQGLASREEISRIEMRSSDFAPEYGDRPGAQVLVETRSGGEEWHGDVSGSLRPRAFDSADWFAQHYRFPLPAASSQGFAASAGGPLVKDSTFLFAAIEQTGVQDSAAQLMVVPSLAARAASHPGYSVLLDAFPDPNGPLLDADEATAVVPLKRSATERRYSLRADQTVGADAHLFAHVAASPSTSSTDNLGNARATLDAESATLGLTAERGAWMHDLRLNYSNASTTPYWSASPVANAAFASIAPAGPSLGAFSGFSGVVDAQPFEQIVNSLAALSIEGSGQLLQGQVATGRQSQAEARYTLSRGIGSHSLEAGADFIGIESNFTNGIRTTSAVASSISSLVQGDSLGLTYSLGRTGGDHSVLPIGSLFAQDTWRVSPRLTILYGLRWEITVPSLSAYSTQLTVGDWNGPGAPEGKAAYTAAINPLDGNSVWPNRYGQVAPRLGLAYQIHPQWVLRVGAGLFYDNALGSLLDPFNLSPLNTWQYVPGTTIGAVTSAPRNSPTLFLPRVWEWRTSAERSLTTQTVVSAAYVGSSGSRLLREQATLQPGAEVPADLEFASSGHSSFHAFEAQLRGNLTPRFYGLLAYTWSHSIDNGSQEGAVFLAGPGYGRQTDRGSSNFDVRHSVTASASWNPAWMKGFVLSSTFVARSGFPFDVTTLDRTIGLGFANAYRADVVPHTAVWIADADSPGGRRLNGLAFQAPASLGGTLGRNVLNGPGLLQIDANLRRTFPIRDRSALEVNVSAFNLLNHANFANPVGYLGSALFGQPVSMQSLMLGSGSPNTGVTPLLQSGGPRTAEVGLTFRF